MKQRLFVGNLPFDTTEEELRDVLSEYGVTTITMPKDRETQRFRGFAFCDVELADKAIKDLNEGDFGGRPIRITIAEERRPAAARPERPKADRW